MSQQQFDHEVTREQWEEMQDALPPHKRDGYAEQMAEFYEYLFDCKREEFNEKV
jgi:hypothetical protein